MTAGINTLRQLLDPVPPSRFFADYYHKRWLHVPGPAERFAPLMSWSALNQLLGMAVWTDRTLQLVLDRRRVPPSAYCHATVDRSRQQVQQPDPERVAALLRNGASLLLNEIETLNPEVLRIARILDEEIGAKSGANVYCSWPTRQAFDSHYDRHDVFALQVIGRKRWRIYEGRAEYPIEHPAFLNVPQEQYDRMKGKVAEEVEMTSGDLLYLPRGQFHDALAIGEASLHITFSCSEPKGLDWLTALWNRAVNDPLFRMDLPRTDGPRGEADLTAHLERLAERLKTMALSPDGIAHAAGMRRGYAIRRGDYRLPANDQPRVFRTGHPWSKVARRGPSWVLTGEAGELALEPEQAEAVRWMLAQGRFELAELQTAQPKLDAERLGSLVDRLLEAGALLEVKTGA